MNQPRDLSRGRLHIARTDWTGTKDALGRIIIRFNHAINTKELKIHCNYDDLDLLQRPIDRAEFKNTPEKLVTVYQKLPVRTESYVYDGMGNRTNEKILLRNEKSYVYTYYGNSNRLKSNGRYTYEYDTNGNLIKRTSTDGNEVWEYSYDLLNQLEQVKKNGTVVSSYVYDPNGFRVEKIGSKGRIDYVPLLNGEVGYRKEFSANMEYSFIYVGGQHLARVNGVIGGDGKKFYYANDHEGNGLVVTDENGNKVVERDFTPFGERIDQAGHEGKFPDETEDGFTGKDWDEDIGLYYFNARWYDPEVGRFISEDSVADDPNLYVYCGNNPVNSIDPTGNFEIKLQEGWNMIGSMLNATALLSNNETLGSISSAFSLFVAIDGRWGLSNIIEYCNDLISEFFTDLFSDSYEKQINKRIKGYFSVQFELRSLASSDPDELYGAILNINNCNFGSMSGENGIESSTTSTNPMDFQQKKTTKDTTDKTETEKQKDWEKRWRQAQRKGDVATLAKLLEERYPGFKYDPKLPTGLVPQWTAWIAEQNGGPKVLINAGLSVTWQQVSYGVSWDLFNNQLGEHGSYLSPNVIGGFSFDLSISSNVAAQNEIGGGLSKHTGLGVTFTDSFRPTGLALHIGPSVNYFEYFWLYYSRTIYTR